MSPSWWLLSDWLTKKTKYLLFSQSWFHGGFSTLVIFVLGQWPTQGWVSITWGHRLLPILYPLPSSPEDLHFVYERGYDTVWMPGPCFPVGCISLCFKLRASTVGISHDKVGSPAGIRIPGCYSCLLPWWTTDYASYLTSKILPLKVIIIYTKYV